MSGHDIELLLLDFEGVCTLGSAELIAAGRGGSNPTLADSIRPECEQIVERAQTAGVLVAILSNEISPTWAGAVPLLRTVDLVVNCSDNGILKPDRRAFQRALYLTGIEAGRTLAVDDDPDNVRVAASLGMKTAAFDLGRPSESWNEVAVRIGVEA